jgi:UDP-N-acetylmuramyl pentapeptide phosphotransferase/UDP-N-acetylglucosamine-1-phosphate transferase
MPFLLSTLVCILALWLILRSPLANRGLDLPNERSLHSHPTPRIGGLGIVAAIVLASLTYRPALPWPIWAALALIVAVSFIDDLGGLRAGIRMPLHLVAATTVAIAAFPDASWPFWLLATVTVAWMINLYNFMDGSDGLAGGQAVFGFGTLAIAALQANDPGIATAAAVVAGAALGFLAFNFPPARIFMGDAGSTSIGLLAGALGGLGVARNLWHPVFPAVAFLPFIFDGSATLLMRMGQGKKLLQAHRDHAYQRLNMSGFGHRNTALLYYGLMLASALVALSGLRPDAGWAATACLLIAFALAYGMVQRSWNRRQSAVSHSHADNARHKTPKQ